MVVNQEAARSLRRKSLHQYLVEAMLCLAYELSGSFVDSLTGPLEMQSSMTGQGQVRQGFRPQVIHALNH